MAEVVLVMAMVAVATLLGVALARGWLGLPGLSGPDDGPTAPGVSPTPDAYYDLDGGVPQAYPDTRLAVGFLTLDDPLQRAIDVLGPPPSTGPDIFGTAYTWALPGGAFLLVSADDGMSIGGVVVVAPSESPVRFSAFGGVVVGSSSLRNVVAAWGPGYVSAAHPEDDFSISYVACVGLYPVIVKFDQQARTQHTYAPASGSRLWDAPVTSLLVAYADEPPGSEGCSLPAPTAGFLFPPAFGPGRYR